MFYHWCKYQMIVQNCPSYCCTAQEGCPPVVCPDKVDDCVTYNKMNK